MSYCIEKARKAKQAGDLEMSTWWLFRALKERREKRESKLLLPQPKKDPS
jgi:hypothetical protein